MKILLTLFAFLLTVFTGFGATVKISGLPLSASPSTNTFIEIADMNAVTKSSKYLLTNLVKSAGDTIGPLSVTGLTNTALTASRAIATGADKSLVSSAVTSTQLGYLSDTTGAIGASLLSKQVGSDNLTNVASGAGIAANWNALGATNSTLPGKASANFGTFTNGFGGGGWFNVKDPAYGATGDGTTDDTAAIQAAVNAAPAPGGIVYFPPGIYKISNTLTGNVSTRFIGSGAFYGTTTNVTRIDASSVTNAAAISFPTGNNFASVQDLQLYGPSSASTSCAGIYFTNGRDQFVNNVFVYRFNRGIDAEFTEATKFDNVNIYGSSAYGMYLNGCNTVMWKGCWITVCATENLLINLCNLCSFFGGGIDDTANTSATAAGVHVTSSSHIVFEGMRLALSPNGYCVNVDSASTAVKIVNCVLDCQSNTTAALLKMAGTNHCVINASVYTYGSGPYLSDTSVGSSFINFTGTNSFIGSLNVSTNVTITNSLTGTSPLIINDVAAGTGNRIDYKVGGTSKFSVGIDGSATSSANMKGFNLVLNGGTLNLDASGNSNLSPESTGVIQFGFDAASATPQFLKAHDGSGTDKVGANFTFEGGQSTGTAAGGATILRTSNSGGGSASSLNAYSERFHAPAKWITLTESSATTIFTLPVPATNYVGLTATVTVYATDGTDHQSQTSVITVDAIAKTTTVTTSISAVANTAAASSGTLTCTYTAVDAGSNVVGIQANAVSSLTQTVLRAKVVVTAINASGTAAITEQ